MIIMVLAFLCQSIVGLPWWTVYVIPFLISYLYAKKESHALIVGFISIFIFWGLISLFKDMNNDSILSSKIGALFMGLGPWGMIIVTSILGGIIGAIGGWSGILIRKITSKSRKNIY